MKYTYYCTVCHRDTELDADGGCRYCAGFATIRNPGPFPGERNVPPRRLGLSSYQREMIATGIMAFAILGLGALGIWLSLYHGGR